MDVREKFLTQSVGRYSKSSPRQAVAASSLEVLRARLDGAMSSLGWWEVFLPRAGGCSEGILKV